MNIRRTIRRRLRSSGASGFTLIELLVTVALLSAVVLIVSQIFRISTEAAGRTAAQSEVFTAAAAFREYVTRLVSKADTFLMIDSPPPTAVRREAQGGDMIFPLRNDRLVLVAFGASGEFESVTDPTRGTPLDPPVNPNPNARYTTSTPATSSQALVTIAPGNPLLDPATNSPVPFNDFLYLNAATNPLYDVPASDWILCSRLILLGVEPGTSTPNFLSNSAVRTISNLVAGGPTPIVGQLPAVFDRGILDFVVGDLSGAADAATLIDRLTRVGRTAGQPPPLAANLVVALNPLVQLNYAPSGENVIDPTHPDYYTRTGFNLMPGIADLRIEWTDGRAIDQNARGGPTADFRTRWFGLKPDPFATPDPANFKNAATMRSISRSGSHHVPIPFNMLTLNEIDEFAVFPRIEWSSNGTGAATNSHYRAVWRADTWDFRPKALKFSFRVFDRNNRLRSSGTIDLNDNGIPDHLENSQLPETVMRYGQAFSFVVPLP